MVKYPIGVKIGILRLCATAYLLAVFSWRFVRTLLPRSDSTKVSSLSRSHTFMPGFGDKRKAMLQDIAILTGGNVVAEELGVKLESVKLEDLTVEIEPS